MLLLLAGFNVFIGLFNLVPLLPFDGGHAAMAIYERVRSRRGKPYHADVRKLIPLSMATIGFLAFIFLSSLYLDIARPVK
jgi:membrane-associated protease RseP (regulator of RpoE activity)